MDYGVIGSSLNFGKEKLQSIYGKYVQKMVIANFGGNRTLKKI